MNRRKNSLTLLFAGVVLVLFGGCLIGGHNLEPLPAEIATNEVADEDDDDEEGIEFGAPSGHSLADIVPKISESRDEETNARIVSLLSNYVGGDRPEIRPQEKELFFFDVMCTDNVWGIHAYVVTQKRVSPRTLQVFADGAVDGITDEIPRSDHFGSGVVQQGILAIVTREALERIATETSVSFSLNGGEKKVSARLHPINKANIAKLLKFAESRGCGAKVGGSLDDQPL